MSNKSVGLAGVALLLITSALAVRAAVPAPAFQKVMIVILENTEYDPAMKQPFLASLAKRGASLTNYHAVSHPSLPNYIALAGGSTFGIKDDGVYNLDGKSIADLLEAHGKSWKVYAEALPSVGFQGAVSGTYCRKHEPFVSFKNISGNPQRLNHIVPADQLDNDARSGQLADYSMYIPDLNNDGHDTTVGFADTWLNKAFSARLNDPAFMKGMLFVVTFDETNTYTGSNHVAAILVGDSVVPGSVSKRNYTHYSLLRTVEDQWGLGSLGQHDSKATAIQDVWKSP